MFYIGEKDFRGESIVGIDRLVEPTKEKTEKTPPCIVYQVDRTEYNTYRLPNMNKCIYDLT